MDNKSNNSTIIVVDYKAEDVCDDVEDCTNSLCNMRHPKFAVGYCVRFLKS